MMARKKEADFLVIKNRTAGYSAIQSFFWMGYAGIMGFVSLYLLHAGFDNAQVGLLIAAAGSMGLIYLGRWLKKTYQQRNIAASH